MSYINTVLGDAFEDANRCKINPNDEVCKAFYAKPAVAADPWAKQGEGTFTASADPGAAIAALVAAPVNALQSLFSAITGTSTPPPRPIVGKLPPPPTKRPLPILPIAIAGAAIIGLVLLMKRKASQ